MSKLKHQIHLEALYSKNQTIERIKAEFLNCKEFDFTAYMESKAIDEHFGFALLVQMVLHKRCSLSTLIGLLSRYCKNNQDCADQLLKAADADLVDWSSPLSVFIVKFNITQDVQDDIDKFQYPLPMVIEPKKITSNSRSGYLLNNYSVILRDNHHTDDVCLDHLNRMNKVELCINQNTASMIKNQWKNLDKRKQSESTEDFQKRKKAFAKYDKSAKEVISLLVQEGNAFYITHRYDKRGRTYASGYHCTYQGNAWNKAVIEFVNKETI